MGVETFDLVTFGTGSAAGAITFRCREAGWKVAAADDRPPGGTCSQRGCDPKKILVAGEEAVDWARRMTGNGVGGGTPRIKWGELVRFKKKYTDPIPESTEEEYARSGVVLIHGRARFAGPDAIVVGDRRLKARHIAIATGMRPRPLDMPGAELATTSNRFMELDRLPRRVLFLGGGYISFEFAHLVCHAGREAVILHSGKRPLGLFDPDLVDRLVDYSRTLGIRVHLNTRAIAIEKSAHGFRVRTNNPDLPAVEGHLVVHGAGRVPNLHDMHLDAGEVQATEKGIRVNEYLQSPTNPRVYAAGDCADTQGYSLTPVAGLEGVLAAHNLLHGNDRKADYAGLPSVVFTLPQLARAGLTEMECREKGMKVDVHEGDTSGWYANRRMNARCGAYKTLVDRKTDRILGAHLLGWEAAETINLFALAIRYGLTATQLRHGLYSYPTNGFDITYMLR